MKSTAIKDTWVNEREPTAPASDTFQSDSTEMIAPNRICVVSVSQASISSEFGGEPNLELLNEETFYRGKSETKRSMASN